MTSFATIDVSVKENKRKEQQANIKVIGVGGGGCNAVGSMIERGLTGVDFVAINTDMQALNSSQAKYKIQVGSEATGGLGAGADPNIGKKAVEEDRDKLSEFLTGTDMIFLTAGMGGGTGTGGAPVIASIAKSKKILTVAIVTKPFRWEGKLRMMNAEKGIHELRQYCDSLIVIPNEGLLKAIDPHSNFFQALDKANEVLYEATRGISDIINIEGLINVDFADVRTVMINSGQALMGCGIGTGDNRIIQAANHAMSSPFLEGMNIQGAKAALVIVTGSSNLTMLEVNEGNNHILDSAGDDVNIIFGCVKRDSMNDYVSYTIIATGFEDQVLAKPVEENKYIDPIKDREKDRTRKHDQQSNAKPEQKPEPKPEKKKNEREAQKSNGQVLDIQRVKTPAQEEPDPKQMGFDFEQFKNTEYSDLNTESSKKSIKFDDDDDEQSAFLREIMS